MTIKAKSIRPSPQLSELPNHICNHCHQAVVACNQAVVADVVACTSRNRLLLHAWHLWVVCFCWYGFTSLRRETNTKHIYLAIFPSPTEIVPEPTASQTTRTSAPLPHLQHSRPKNSSTTSRYRKPGEFPVPMY